jgi:hypothetical protein
MSGLLGVRMEIPTKSFVNTATNNLWWGTRAFQYLSWRLSTEIPSRGKQEQHQL